MGYIRSYADRMNLAAMTSRNELSSTGHALGSSDSAHSEWLIYAPSGGNFTVNLSNVVAQLAAEWMNPATGAKTTGASVSGGSTVSFTPPFSGDAVLYLRRSGSSPAQK